MTKKSQPFMMLLGKRTSSFHPGKTSNWEDSCKHVYKLPPLLLSLKCTLVSLHLSDSPSLSYPYSEDYTKPTQYMNTRCPAWCDRILMSHTAQEFIQRVSQCLLSLYLKQNYKIITFCTLALHFHRKCRIFALVKGLYRGVCVTNNIYTLTWLESLL